jgi:uncharacterized protein
MKPMKGSTLAAIAGALFALGLAIGGMTVPGKVTGFLDIGGSWDPQLAFVMAGAIGVYASLLRLIRHRTAPLCGAAFHWPDRSVIDVRLVGGAAIFGVGWGLSGYCPGPALASIVGGAPETVAFVGAMIVGIAAARLGLRAAGRAVD